MVPVPALSARRADVVPLTEHFLQHFAVKLRQRPLTVAPEAMRVLEYYPWPGNVRELKNVLERASILTPADQPLTVDGLPLELQLFALVGSPASSAEDERSLRGAEKQHIQRILLECGGNKTEAARLLGIAITTLYRKIQEYGL